MYPPYYIVPDVEKYKTLDPHSEEAVKLGRRIAANIGDYASLRLVLGIDPPEFACFYPDMLTAQPSTFDTIDSFLDKFGSAPSAPEPAAPYSLEESDFTPPQPANAINDGIDAPAAQVNEEIKLTPKELIKLQRYEEALKLIERQNLNNPQKSIYFAHQMRFLKKLIAIQNHKNKSKG